jgi:nitroreductase
MPTSVSEALATRLSVRAFLPTPIPKSQLETILTKAARSPSGGNLQPWIVRTLTGAPLETLLTAVAARVAESPRGEAQEYTVYPDGLGSPYTDRRFKIGEDMYALLGITREDRAARRAWFNNNFRLFGAPVGLFCFIDRVMSVGQFSDLGMFLQSIMLLLREEGLDSCPQESWAMFAPTVYKTLKIPENLMLFCALAIGHRDPAAPVNRLVSDRAPLSDFATFEGFAP